MWNRKNVFFQNCKKTDNFCFIIFTVCHFQWRSKIFEFSSTMQHILNWNYTPSRYHSFNAGKSHCTFFSIMDEVSILPQKNVFLSPIKYKISSIWNFVFQYSHFNGGLNGNSGFHYCSYCRLSSSDSNWHCAVFVLERFRRILSTFLHSFLWRQVSEKYFFFYTLNGECSTKTCNGSGINYIFNFLNKFRFKFQSAIKIGDNGVQ